MRLPDRPHEARPAPAVVNIGKTLAQVVIMWGFFLFFVPFLIGLFENALGIARFALPAWVGILVFGFFSAIGLYSAMLFATFGRGTPLPLDTATKLVILGPYRYVRNPMAIAGIAQGIGVGLYRGSYLVLLYSVAGAFAWHYLARPWEEADLSTRFGEDYDEYQRAVPLWWPRLRPYRSVKPLG